MTSASRKLRRKKKKNLEKKMQEQINMFELLPEQCYACGKEYNKKDKQMAMKWVVKVYQDEQRVDLLCPDCMEREDV